MLTPPPSWTRTAGEHVLVLRPPRGEGRIRFHAELAVRSFPAIVADLLAGDPGFVETGRGVAQRVVTREGEYGAWLELSGSHEGRPARRWLGAIFLDVFVAAVDGMSVEPEADAEIGGAARALLDGASFGAGVRRRRYVYATPPGWQALPTGLIATWYPADYPRHRAQIVVYPAEPSRRQPRAVFDELLANEESRGFVRSGPVAIEAFSGRLTSGLWGSFAGAWPHDRTATDRHAIVLCDSRHAYVQRLESAAPEHLDADVSVLRALAASVERLPHRGAGALAADRGSLSELGGPWAD